MGNTCLRACGFVEIIERTHGLEDPKCALLTNFVHKTFGHEEVLQSYAPPVTNFDNWSNFAMVLVADVALRSNSLKISHTFINLFRQNKRSISQSTT